MVFTIPTCLAFCVTPPFVQNHANIENLCHIDVVKCQHTYQLKLLVRLRWRRGEYKRELTEWREKTLNSKLINTMRIEHISDLLLTNQKYILKYYIFI